MLPPFIIDQIRQREDEEQDALRPVQPVLELPLPTPEAGPKRGDRDSTPPRGVVIIDL